MAAKPLIVAAVLLTAGLYWWSERPANQYRADQAQSDSPYGFIPVPMDRQAPVNEVLIISALNCPSGGSQRARTLAEQLQSRGIPHQRRNEYRIASGPIDEQLAVGLQRLERVMEGETPAVFINHMGTANPTLEQVIGEFQRQVGY